MTLKIRLVPSPNHDDRKQDAPLRYVVLHYTGMPAGAWLKAALDPTVKLSAHYMIDEDGGTVRLVDESRRAWHAGASFWRGITDMNSASIGIELVNPGHENGYRPFPDKQIAALTKLLQDITSRLNIDPRFGILGHSDIAPGRKKDPGELFPWRTLARNGFGLWPDVQDETSGSEASEFCEEEEVAEILESIGYFYPRVETLVTTAKDVLLAFQRRYFPENLNGLPDAGTIARLKALSSLQSK